MNEQTETKTQELFFANVAYTLEQDDIRGMFEGFGAVLKIRLAYDAARQSRGFGFIEMPVADAEDEDSRAGALCAQSGKTVRRRRRQAPNKRKGQHGKTDG